MKILAFFILVLCFAVNGFGQSKAQAASKSISPKYESNSFDTKVSALPPRYLGHDARSFLPTFLSFALEIVKGCGKYETTKNCQSRLNGMYDRRISAKLTASDLLAFSIPIECDYIADANEGKMP